MRKLIVVINGAGGVGKDTLIGAVKKKYSVRNVYSITPIKRAAEILGWSNEKDDKSRKFLSDLKLLSTEYNDYPLKRLLSKTHDFLRNDISYIMFVHVREPQEIKKYVEAVNAKVVTLLIRRKAVEHDYGNMADDNVENYEYDYIYENELPLDKAEADFMDFFEGIMVWEGVKK